MLSIEQILFTVAVLLLLSILASKASVRLGVPALILFLFVGMLAGSEGPGGIEFDNPWLAQSVGAVALSFILFAAGFETKWHRMRPVVRGGLSLATIGVMVSTACVGLLSHWMLGFSLVEGMLLGAIVSSTDAAAVFSVLRGRNLNLRERPKRLLELESGSNDPMAVLLTVGLIQVITQPEVSVAGFLIFLVAQLSIGATSGFALGKLTVLAINRAKLEWEGLYPVLSIAALLMIYAATSLLKGNGFLAVYVAGLVLGNSDFVHRRSLRLFHDGLAWLMQICMFLVLGLQVFPSRIVPAAASGLIMSAGLLFVARPLSVFVSLLFSRIGIGERLFLSWAGLRGAVPIVLATFPLLAGLEKADVIFNIVFFITLTSVLLQGTTLGAVAKWTGCQLAEPPRKLFPLDFSPTAGSDSELVEMEVEPSSDAIGRRIVELRFPPGALIVLMSRDNQFIVPGGSTILHAGDRLMVMADRRQVADLLKLLGAVIHET